ncbi:DUF4465 domain-containing protein [Rubripirellula amarantea]|nr:DUF4465 domain-containing protein [Rubripirellula amarantea]
MNRISKLQKSRRPIQRRRLITELLETRNLLAGPYAPAAGQVGSEAINAGSNLIAAWATGVANYTQGSNVSEDFQTPENATGPSDPLEGDDSPIPDTVTLGDGGEITLTFDDPIRDGIGNDFAVFENSFSDTFLELAFVEVSTDGINFVRFDNESLTPAPVEAFGSLDPTDINGLAGKYRGGFGVGFDLADLGLDKVTHVRIVDIVGDGSSTDTSGNPIYDPFPGTGSAGFDLDAVAVIHQYAMARDVVDFETLGASLPTNSFFNGPTANGNPSTGEFGDAVVIGSFTAETLTLNNTYSQDFGSWNGFAYSNATDNTTAGFANQHSSIAGTGAEESPTYGVGFVPSGNFYAPPTMTRDVDDDRSFESLAITNTTYAALSMRDGDMFAKKFGGTSGDDPDYLLLTINGFDSDNNSIGTVDFYLADYRFDDNSLDYIVDQWTTVDLSAVADASSLQFSIESTDVGAFGINTPTYFAIDDITLSKPVLPIGLADGEVQENGGDAATMLRLSRADSDTSSELVISLATDVSGAISIPDQVTIAVGDSFVDVPVAVIDNAILSDDLDVLISATAPGFADASITLSIVNDDFALSISIDSAQLTESDAPPTATLEDIGRGLAPDSYLNQANDPDGFTSGELSFSNSFDPTFGSWSGWAVSNVTDITTAGYTNQYAAITGSGAGDSATYLMGNSYPGGFAATIERDPATTTAFTSIDITNSVYAALSMRDGDGFAKKFGGADGSDPDFLTLTITGFDSADTLVGTIDVSLADFRFDDDSQDFILDVWQTVDLTSIGTATELHFGLESSDVGQYGMNTPAYFAADNVRTVGMTALPTFTITRETTNVASPLDVTVTTTDGSELSTPTIVTIPAGQNSIEVPISITPDLIVDGLQSVTLSIDADGYVGTTTELTVADADAPSLSLTLSALEAFEDTGSLSAVLHRNDDDLTSPLEVTLGSSNSTVATVPTTVTIPAGLRTVSFDISLIDNDEIEDDRTLTITAVSGELSDEVVLVVNDDDTLRPALEVQLTESVVSEAGARTTVDFEELGSHIAAESFNNGSDLAGGFDAGGVMLDNDYNTDFGSWSGFAISNVTDSQTAGFTNQHSAITGSGALASATYAVANTFGTTPPTLTLTDPSQSFASLDITNATYAALSMQFGDAFAKQFGGESGDNPDFFRLTIAGTNALGESVGAIDFYLADFRFDDQSLDYIVDQWTTVDVSELVGARSLTFSLMSSDVGQFGMNTPAYFAIDNVILTQASDSLAPMATVTRRNSDTTDALEVMIGGGDETEVTLPTRVVIPAGETSVSFPIPVVDDSWVDGDKIVEFTASAEGFFSASGSLTVEDDDAPTLTLTLVNDVVSESAATSLLVHHNYETLAQPLNLTLSADNADITLPDEIVIPTGSSSVLVDVAVSDNQIADGNRNVTIEVIHDETLSSTIGMTINDDEVPAIVVSIAGEGLLTFSEAIETGSFDVRLSAQPLGNVTIAVSSDSDELMVMPTELTFTPEDWNSAQTVSLQSPIDLIIEPSETFTILLTASDADTAALFDGIETSIDVVVEDYQPSSLVIAANETHVTVSDVDLDLAIQQELLADGLDVTTSDSPQTFVVEGLPDTTGTINVRTAGGDDWVTLRTPNFVLLDGGEGYDTLEIDANLAIDITSLVGESIIGFEAFVLGGESSIRLDVQHLDQLVDPEGVLVVRKSTTASFAIEGEIASQPPIMVDDEFRQVIQAGEYVIQIVSGTPWQNAANRFDTNRSGDITSLDALQVINRIARQNTSELSEITSLDDFDDRYYDVNGDNHATALDALQIINEIARQQPPAETEHIDLAFSQWPELNDDKTDPTETSESEWNENTLF